MKRLERPDWLHAGFVTLALLALYAITAPRTVVLEDDGLFVLSSYSSASSILPDIHCIRCSGSCSRCCRSARSPTACIC